MGDIAETPKGKCCIRCAYWNSSAPHPENFAPCVAPMSEALLGWFAHEGIQPPALLKLFAGGVDCKAFRAA